MATRWKSILGGASGIALSALIILSSLTGCVSLRGTDPLSPQERLNLGVSYEHAGKLDLALREYQRGEVGSMKSIARAYQGNIYLARNAYPEAIERYRAALEVDPDNLVALNNLAWTLALEGHSLDEAEALIEQALALDPQPRDPYEHTLRKISEARASGAP